MGATYSWGIILIVGVWDRHFKQLDDLDVVFSVVYDVLGLCLLAIGIIAVGFAPDVYFLRAFADIGFQREYYCRFC